MRQVLGGNPGEPAATGQSSERASFVSLFTPKLVTVLREGYGWRHLRLDAMAGLTVAVVALPLSMAIAIASGASPAQGLYTAIVGGFLVSLLGGSRFQVGGPAGAFIVIVATTISVHGMDGLILATVLAGGVLVLAGLLRLGSFIKLVPYPVTVGFTAGIALIIFASQLKDLLGLSLAETEPVELVAKLPVLWRALPTFDIKAFATALVTILLIAGLKHARPGWPGILIAIVVAGAATALLQLPLETIGTKYGGIPRTLPAPSLPVVSWDKLIAVMPSAVSLALLGAIESLLSAVVADGMTGRRHRSNCELVAQGVANIGSALVGGICVTGAIARTATNIRAGAHGPVAGMLHAVFLLGFVLLAAPLAAFIPLASLAGVLAVVAWNMAERRAFGALLRASPGDAAVLLTTFGLTLFRNLTEAILVGFAMGSLLFIQRMSKAVAVHAPLISEDRADVIRKPDIRHERPTPERDIVTFRFSGALFFGASASIESVLERIADAQRVLILDFTSVPFIDATAAHLVRAIAEKARSKGVDVRVTGTSAEMRRDLFVHGVRPPLVHFDSTIETAQAKAKVR